MVLLLAVLVLGYLLAVFLTRDIWAGREGTRVTLTAQMRDGSPPPSDAMPQAVNVVEASLEGRAVSDAEVAVDGSNVVATFPGRDLGTDALRDMFGPGETKTLYVRPVIHAITAGTQTPPPATGAPPQAPGAGTWADFTAANMGTQTAFTLDTQVISAPQIMETIPDGRTQITGQFDADSARELADALNRGASPLSLSFESSTDEMLAATTLSKVLRVAEIAAGVFLAAVVLGAAVHLTRSRQREQ